MAEKEKVEHQHELFLKEQKAKEIEQKMQEEIAHTAEVCKVHNETKSAI